MSDYNQNYLKQTAKIYPPKSRNLKKITGAYMFTAEYKHTLISTLGDSEYILFEFLYSRKTYNYFIPTDNKAMADAIGWTESKVERIKSNLTKAGYLLILKDTAKDGAKFYRVLLGKELVSFYKEHNHFPPDYDVVVLPKEVSDDY